MKPLRLALLVLAGSAVLLAQSTPRLVAEIPFAFEMANEKFPAGEYEVTNRPDESVLLVRNTTGHTAAIATSNILGYDVISKAEVRLVFNKYGDRHFLSEAWYPNVSRRLMKSRNERTMVTSTFITSNAAKVVIVAIAF